MVVVIDDDDDRSWQMHYAAFCGDLLYFIWGAKWDKSGAYAGVFETVICT